MHQMELLSSPYEGNFASFAAELSHLHLKLLCTRLIQTGSVLESANLSIPEDVRRTADTHEASVLSYSPEIGIVYRSVMLNQVNAVTWEAICAQLALGAYLSGLLPQISLVIEHELPLYAAGFRIPPGHHIIQGSAVQLTVLDACQRRILQLTSRPEPEVPPVWLSDQDLSIPLRLGSGSQVLFGKQHDAWLELGGASEHTPTHSPAQTAMQFARALNFLEEAVPEYYIWVVLILRHITPIVRRNEMMLGSASNFFLPGISQITTPATLSETLEMLIRECSRHYYHLGMRFGSMTAASASSGRPDSRERPLDRILTGYHALGNVQLLYRQLLKRHGAHVLPARAQMVEEEVATLAASLEQESQHLSALGKAFYEPLRARLAA